MVGTCGGMIAFIVAGITMATAVGIADKKPQIALIAKCTKSVASPQEATEITVR
jgi:hypothetical protein